MIAGIGFRIQEATIGTARVADIITMIAGGTIIHGFTFTSVAVDTTCRNISEILIFIPTPVAREDRKMET